jgi:hypothetical protein
MNVKQKALLITAILVWALAAYTYAQTVWAGDISNTGEIISVELEFYTNSSLTTQLTTLTWGQIGNGTVNNQTIWIKNAGNHNSTLAFTTVGLPSFLALTWNYTDQTIEPSMAIPVNFTLTVDPTASGSFAFTTRIFSTETEN